MAASIAYIAASTNRHPQAADISPGSIIALGSSSLVGIGATISDGDCQILETLPGHEGLVTCIRFFSDHQFVSADDKGVLISWGKNGSQWKLSKKIQAHDKAISSLCVHGACIVTGSSDASVKIWDVAPGDESDELNEVQVLPLQGKYPLSLDIAYLPGSKVTILAIAGTDQNVQIWVRSEDVFVLSAVLAGHEDWVRSVAFRHPQIEGEPLTLASGSQDATIRLWRIEAWNKDISPIPNRPQDALSDELLDAFEASLGDLGEGEEGGRQISLKRHILTVKSVEESLQQFSITFDALLIGHEAGVTSLSWRPTTLRSTSTLLSTSTDSSLILWSPSAILNPSEDDSTSIWINRQRFGDIGGQRLGGFVGGAWAQNGNEVLAWGWSGGWRRWCCKDSTGREAEEIWAEAGAIGGHSGPVKGIDWSSNGSYLISAGLDQTTRIHGAMSSTETGSLSWHELSRPQVHGYDVLGAVFLDPLRFVSIADEKVVRVFEAPRGFVNLIEGLNIAEFTEKDHDRPLGASVPPLGLSNKATAEANTSTSSDVASTFRRPFEGELASTTLWPEVEKIFGHGYESVALAVSYSGKYIATACKATTAEHAVIRIYDSETYQPFGQPLEGHSLTVTKISFSRDDQYVLSVSRDRSWRLFELCAAGGYTAIAADKTHARIIWDCAWAPKGHFFATASRDKTVKIWGQGDTWTNINTIKTKAAATAVDFSTCTTQNRCRLAVGLDSGEILIYSSSRASMVNWRLDSTFDSSMAHIGHIYRLAWRPETSDASLTELASCSEDGTVRILIVQIDGL